MLPMANGSDFQFEINDDGTLTVTKYRGGEAMPVVPDEFDGYAVTGIGDWAFGRFFGKQPLLGITLPESIVSIGEYAFSNCKKLSSVNIPSGVRYIGAAAFSGCASLMRITLPQSVAAVNDWLFKDCRALTKIKIPYDVRTVGKGAFSGCHSVTEIFLPDEVSAIEFETFRDCRRLARLDLPPAVTRIGDSAFKGCHSLANLTVPPRVTFIGGTDVFPSGTILHAYAGSYTEIYAKSKRHPFIALEKPAEDLPEYKYSFEPIGNESVTVNKSMLEVLRSIHKSHGREVFSDGQVFKNLLNDLLPGGKNAGARNVLIAAAVQLKAAVMTKHEADPAAEGRLAESLIDLGYQPKLAREAASCFWTVL